MGWVRIELKGRSRADEKERDISLFLITSLPLGYILYPEHSQDRHELSPRSTDWTRGLHLCSYQRPTKTSGD